MSHNPTSLGVQSRLQPADDVHEFQSNDSVVFGQADIGSRQEFSD